MEFEIEARLTQSLLGSGRVIAQAGNVAALLAGAGWLLPGTSLGRWMFLASLLCWIAGSWLAIRVAIDARLFRVFAEGDAAATGKALDDLLVRLGLGKPLRNRTLPDRSRGALRLWRCQIVACTFQLAILIVAGAARARCI